MTLDELQVQLQNYGDYPHALGPYYTALTLMDSLGKLSGKLSMMVQDPEKKGFTSEEKNLIAMSLGDILRWVSHTASDLGLNLNDVVALELKKLSLMRQQTVKKG